MKSFRNSGDVKFATIFENTVSSSVSLKIVGTSPQLDQKPAGYLSKILCQLLLSIYMIIVFKYLKIKKVN